MAVRRGGFGVLGAAGVGKWFLCGRAMGGSGSGSALGDELMGGAWVGSVGCFFGCDGRVLEGFGGGGLALWAARVDLVEMVLGGGAMRWFCGLAVRVGPFGLGRSGWAVRGVLVRCGEVFVLQMVREVRRVMYR